MSTLKGRFAIEGIPCGVGGLVGNVLWGSGGMGRVPTGGTRSVRGAAAAGLSGAHAGVDSLCGARRHPAAAHGERNPPDDARRRRQPPARRSPLPAPPSAPPR